MAIQLTPTQARVLGALIEKEITTPEYYPLSLNALVNACNQKNNRDPVTTLDEAEVRQALHGLETERLAGPVRGDSRVAKYEHRTQEIFNFTRGEVAILCVLLLRGPQTPGELRGRTERMFHFDELTDVLNALQKLMTREPALAKVLPRQPGTKEARYAHLLSGEVESFEPATTHSTQSLFPSQSPHPSSSSHSSSHAQSYSYVSTPQRDEPVRPDLADEDTDLSERMAQLEAEVAILTRELAELRHEFTRLSKHLG